MSRKILQNQKIINHDLIISIQDEKINKGSVFRTELWISNKRASSKKIHS